MRRAFIPHYGARKNLCTRRHWAAALKWRWTPLLLLMLCVSLASSFQHHHKPCAEYADMALYFGKQEKPKRNPAMADAKKMYAPGDELIDGTQPARVPPALNKGKESPAPKKDAAAPAPPKAKGMGVGKPLVSKSFTDGDDKFKITVTKEE